MPKPPSLGAVTSKFGMRKHPITGVWKMHNGEDRKSPGNYAPVTGVVLFAGYDTSGMGFGNAVGIREDTTGDVWWTAHHASLNVAVGDEVIERATYMGPTGMTGAAAGIHSHQEVRRGGGARPGSGVAYDPATRYSSTAGGGGTTPFPPDIPNIPQIPLKGHDDMELYSTDPPTPIPAKYLALNSGLTPGKPLYMWLPSGSMPRVTQDQDLIAKVGQQQFGQPSAASIVGPISFGWFDQLFDQHTAAYKGIVSGGGGSVPANVATKADVDAAATATAGAVIKRIDALPTEFVTSPKA